MKSELQKKFRGSIMVLRRGAFRFMKHSAMKVFRVKSRNLTSKLGWGKLIIVKSCFKI